MVCDAETAVIVKLQSGTIVQMQVDSKAKDKEFCASIEEAVNQQMGGTWTLEHDPVIDVAFPDDESQNVLSNRYLELVTTPMVVT